MDQKAVSLYGQVAVSILSQLIFAGTAVAAFFVRDDNLLLLVVGAVIANATTTINFWVGSSSGSQKKDDIVHAVTTRAEQTDQPVAIAINNPKPDDK